MNPGPNALAAESSAIDVPTLLVRCRHNKAFALTLVEELAASGVQAVAAIEDGVRQGQFDQVRDLAHGLKGSAGIIAAESLRSVSHAVEQASAAGDASGLALLTGELRQELDRCLASVRILRNQLD